MVLEVEIACLLGIHADGFGFVPNRLDLIDTMGGGNRLASGVISDQGGHSESLRQYGANTKLRRS